MVIFNPTRKLKSSDGLMVLFQSFLISEISHFLSRTVDRLIIFISWPRWLRSATYHYVDNGFYDKLLWSGTKLILAILFPEKAPLLCRPRLKSVTHLWRAQNEAAWDRAYRKLSNQYRERTLRGPSLQMLKIDNGYYNKCSITFKTFYKR